MKVKKILLVSAFFPPSVGGPTTFVSEIGKVFQSGGYTVEYANFERYKNFSKIKRDFLFLRNLWRLTRNTDLVLIADTWSALIPAVFVCLIRRKKYIVRIGGDFLWETYIARTKDYKKLSTFYVSSQKLSLKEKLIFFLTNAVLRLTGAVVFNTSWQKDIWEKPYNLDGLKTHVIENALVVPSHQYLWKNGLQKIIQCPVRTSEFKNVETLKKVWERIRNEYTDVSLSFEYIHPKDRSRILSESYAVFQPSISDVAPNLICESIASGCPFVCTEDTGIKNLIPNGVGLYIDTTNENSIEQGLRMILDENMHTQQVKMISELKIERTYEVLAKEYQAIWNKI